MKTVIFISDSSLDIYANRALVGTSAYQSFLDILALYDLSINDTLLYNETDLRTIEAIAQSDMSVKVITIGEEAERIMLQSKIPFYALPNISKLQGQSLSSFDNQFKNCLEFINDCPQH